MPFLISVYCLSFTGANHPAPSPVHHQQQPVHAHPGGHPPNAGTPQPAMVYQATAGPQMGQQHPPLQPSPHTPTSPQAVHPVSFPYTFSSQPVNIQQGATPYTSFAHTHSYTTATNAHQYQQQQHNIHNATAQSQPQLVMMPHTTHNPQYQQGAPPQMTGQPQQVGQFQAAPAHMQGITRAVLISTNYGSSNVTSGNSAWDTNVLEKILKCLLGLI